MKTPKKLALNKKTIATLTGENLKEIWAGVPGPVPTEGVSEEYYSKCAENSLCSDLPGCTNPHYC